MARISKYKHCGLLLISADSVPMALIYKVKSNPLGYLIFKLTNLIVLYGRGALRAYSTRYPMEWVVLYILSTCVPLILLYQIRWLGA